MDIKSMLGRLKSALHRPTASDKVVWALNKKMDTLRFELRHDALIDKAINDTSRGVTDTRWCDAEVVVSLTTYGKRLYDAAATVESVMQGTMLPNRIILWLADDLRSATLPLTLQNQQRRGLEVRFCRDIRSYKKLVPTLTVCPDSVIITIDDDVLYRYDVVEKLVNDHIAHPDCIIGNRINRIVLGADGRPVSYKKWQWCSNPTDCSFLNFSTGVGGVLYPPHCLAAEVTDESVFMDICPHADDVWFYAMAVKAGTPTRKGYTHNHLGQDFVENPSVQDVGLARINLGGVCANDVQLKAVFDRYGLWDKLA